MKVEEIKAKLPLADVYEFKEDAKYILIINRDQCPNSQCQATLQILTELGISAFAILVDDPTNAIMIFEVKDEENIQKHPTQQKPCFLT